MRILQAVPPDWQHPTDENGMFIPMHMELFEDAMARWIADDIAWNEKRGYAYELCKDLREQGLTWAEVDNPPPDPKYYRHRKWTDEEATHFQWYENVSEGTPVSPILASIEEGEEWWEKVGKYQGCGRKMYPEGAPPSKWLPIGAPPGAKLYWCSDGTYEMAE